MEECNASIIRDPFLGEPQYSSRKKKGRDQGDDIAEERYEEVYYVGVVRNKFSDIIVHFYPFQPQNNSEEHPWPQ